MALHTMVQMATNHPVAPLSTVVVIISTIMFDGLISFSLLLQLEFVILFVLIKSNENHNLIRLMNVLEFAFIYRTEIISI